MSSLQDAQTTTNKRCRGPFFILFSTSSSRASFLDFCLQTLHLLEQKSDFVGDHRTPQGHECDVEVALGAPATVSERHTTETEATDTVRGGGDTS